MHRIMHVGEFRRMRMPDGTFTGGVYGCIKVIKSVLEKHPASRVVIVWDRGRALRRQQIYALYKFRGEPATQQEKQELEIYMTEWHDQQSKLIELLPFLGIHSCMIPNKEGDDLLCMVSKLGSSGPPPAEDVVIVSSDSDMYQLVTPKVSIWRIVYSPAGMQEYMVTYQKILNECGCSPSDLIFSKAMSGDGSDNIPGIPGVGGTTIDGVIRACAGPGGVTLSKIQDYCLKYEGKGAKRYKAIADNLEIVKRNLELVDISKEPFTELEMTAIHNHVWGASYDVNEPEVMQRLGKYGMGSILKQFEFWIRPFRRLS